MSAAQINKEDFSDEEFIAKYSKMFHNKIIEYAKKLKTPLGNVILAKDCPRDQIWRMDIFPEYKQNRSIRGKPIEPFVFQHTYNTLIPQLLAQYNTTMLGYPKAEADDVIAVLHAKIRAAHPNLPITVMTCDTDLLQLSNHEETCKTHIMDFQMKSLVKAPIKPVLHVYLEYKIICGDESDNIPAIDNKIGKVTAAKLATNPDLLAKRLIVPEVKANYERNQTLINLARIPRDIQDGIMNLI